MKKKDPCLRQGSSSEKAASLNASELYQELENEEFS